jgi:hypothetical protein
MAIRRASLAVRSAIWIAGAFICWARGDRFAVVFIIALAGLTRRANVVGADLTGRAGTLQVPLQAGVAVKVPADLDVALFRAAGCFAVAFIGAGAGASSFAAGLPGWTRGQVAPLDAGVSVEVTAGTKTVALAFSFSLGALIKALLPTASLGAGLSLWTIFLGTPLLTGVLVELTAALKSITRTLGLARHALIGALGAATAIGTGQPGGTRRGFGPLETAIGRAALTLLIANSVGEALLASELARAETAWHLTMALQTFFIYRARKGWAPFGAGIRVEKTAGLLAAGAAGYLAGLALIDTAILLGIGASCATQKSDRQ